MRSGFRQEYVSPINHAFLFHKVFIRKNELIRFYYMEMDPSLRYNGYRAYFKEYKNFR